MEATPSNPSLQPHDGCRMRRRRRRRRRDGTAGRWSPGAATRRCTTCGRRAGTAAAWSSLLRNTSRGRSGTCDPRPWRCRPAQAAMAWEKSWPPRPPPLPRARCAPAGAACQGRRGCVRRMPPSCEAELHAPLPHGCHVITPRPTNVHLILDGPGLCGGVLGPYGVGAIDKTRVCGPARRLATLPARMLRKRPVLPHWPVRLPERMGWRRLQRAAMPRAVLGPRSVPAVRYGRGMHL